MKLSGTQVKQIHDALLGGYDANTLRMMLRMELDLDLATVAGGDNYSQVVFNLISWAEKNGKVLELVSEAWKQNKGNTVLAALAQQVPTWPALTQTVSESPQPTSPAAVGVPNWKMTGIELVKIPAGEFLYGDNKKRVKLEEFWIGRTPVTDRQYQVFIDSTDYDPPKHWQGNRVHSIKMNHPVVNASWHDAQAFCEWAGVFLPTEQQWEKAARGTDGREYPWGNQEPSPQLCNYNQNVGDTTPVGRYSPQGNSPYGIVDMAGNVWEWCQDSYKESDPFTSGRSRQPDIRPYPWLDEGESRSMRGGSWYFDDKAMHCAVRVSLPPMDRSIYLGFRVVVFPGRGMRQ